MKRVVLFAMGIGSACGAFAQRTAYPVAARGSVNPALLHTARTSGVGSYDTLSNIVDTATLIYYSAGSYDSGFVSGTDVYGDMGYAERYDFNGADSSLKIVGVMTLFGGSVSPGSTKSAIFYAWNVGSQQSISSTLYESGFPNDDLASVSVPFTQLGVPVSDTLQDTIKIFMFPTPTGYLTSSFFVGYTLSYSFSSLSGDTIALYGSLDGDRTSPLYTVSGGDTIINNQNATMYSDGSWHDNATDNFTIFNDFFILPIVEVGLGTASAGVKGVTKSGLTFYGNCPNPAANSTDIEFSLATAADVTVTVMDMTGRQISSIQQNGLQQGNHDITLATSDMPSGNYLYVIHTSAGGGVAAKFTVAH